MLCNNVDNEPMQPTDPCSRSPCGPNTQCNSGICICLPEYFGDPYVGCRPECVLSTDCSTDKACIRNKCVDPCPGTCGQNSLCNVINHTPMCSCPPGTAGNAFISCDVMRGTIPKSEKPDPYIRVYVNWYLSIIRSSAHNETMQPESLRPKQHMSRIKWTSRMYLCARIPWIAASLPTRMHS